MEPINKCGANTRRPGIVCKRTALANGRCRLHGGRSTGPKTAEGRARISEAQKARWRRVAEALALQASQTAVGVGSL